MRCYVCLENCSYKSPCRCGTPVHRSCLFHLHFKGFHHCGVCNDYLETSDYLLLIVLIVFRWAFL